MNNAAWIDKELEEQRKDGLFRAAREYPSLGGKFELDGREVLNFSTNDYLNLGRDARVLDASKQALETFGASASASRLVTGSLSLHGQLEEGIADFLGTQAALVFGAGYLANLGLLSALLSRGDIVVADKFVHASLIDGILLSRSQYRRYVHNDMNSLESLLEEVSSHRKPEAKLFVCTESVFSMDGDKALLPEIGELCERYEALLVVDEAHALGVFGQGRGLASELGLTSKVDVLTGTLSKSFGSYGGLVAGERRIRDFLVNKARSFIYNTALPPASVAGASAALDIVEASPGLGEELLCRAKFFRTLLAGAGFDVLKSESQIVPIQIGENEKAISFSKALEQKGVLGVAIRPPTVPVGTARIRFSVTLAHTEEDLRRAGEIIAHIGKEQGVL